MMLKPRKSRGFFSGVVLDALKIKWYIRPRNGFSVAPC
jgi:hypothetical protein